MKVLHILHQFAPESTGGVESYVADLCRAQQVNGIDVCLLVGSKVARKQPGIERLDVDGLQVHRIHRNDIFFDHYASTWNPVIEGLVESLLDRLRPDVVHVHHWIRITSNLVEIADRLGIPSVVTLHDAYTSCPRIFRVREGDAACMRQLSVESCASCVPRFGCEPPDEVSESIDLYKDQYQAELSMARAVHVGIDATADLIHETTGFPRQEINVFPLGYRRRFQGQALPSPVPQDAEPFRFAYWGSIGPHKGVRVLVRAFREIAAARGPGRAELHVLGAIHPPELDSELRDMASGLPVHFHGAFDHTRLLEVAPHMGVFPSTCIETFGLVLDECFEMGLPCIVSDKGALPIRAGSAGLVVRSGDAEALARAMNLVLSDPGIPAGLRAKIPELPPTPEQHEAELRSVYDSAISGPRPQFDPVPGHRRLALLLTQLQNARGLVSPDGPR